MNKITLSISITALAISIGVVGLSVHQLVLVQTVHTGIITEQYLVPHHVYETIIFNETDNTRLHIPEHTWFEKKYNTVLEHEATLYQCYYINDRTDKTFTTWSQTECPQIWAWN